MEGGKWESAPLPPLSSARPFEVKSTSPDSKSGSTRAPGGRGAGWALWVGAALYLALYYPGGLREATPKDLRVLLHLGAVLILLLPLARARRKLPHLLVLYFTLAACLAVSEIGLRVIGRKPEGEHLLFRYDERLGWAFEAGREVDVESKDYKSRVRINSEGFRDVEHGARDGAEGFPVVAVVGDSFTSNVGVSLEELFTTVADARLPRHTVMNFGVNGYGQVQELLLLADVLERERPAFVALVLYVRNDFDDNLGEFDWIRGYSRPRCELTATGELEIDARVPPPTPRTLYERAADGVQALRVFGLAKSGLYKLRYGMRSAPRSKRPSELRYCRNELGEAERKALRVTGLLLERMRDACDAAGAGFGVVVAPTLWQVHPDEWHELFELTELGPEHFDRTRPQREVLARCAELEVPCLDLLPTLEAHAAAGELLYYPREQHWTALGNLRVAEALADWLEAAAGG